MYDRSWRTPLALLAAALQPGCHAAPSSQPELLAMEPALAPAHRTFPLTLIGRGFQPLIELSFERGGASRIDASFRVTVAGHPLTQVRYCDATHLTALLPADIAPGTHDVELVDPAVSRGCRAA